VLYPARKAALSEVQPLLPRMTLGALRTGRIEAPPRTLVHGVEGVGKTTFGANSPAPIFLGAEDGTGHLDVTRFPQPETWGHVREAIATLTKDQHKYLTLVIDTVDWVEPLLWQHICERDKKADIEAYGFGKGYTAAVQEWRVLVADLERLRAARQMGIILLAHSHIKSFKNPQGEDFDRYELKINQKAGGLLKEWVDTVLFANFEMYAARDGRTSRVRGVSTGARLAYTQRTAAYDAKNRSNLPESIALDYPEYAAAMKDDLPEGVDGLIAEVVRKATELGGDIEVKAMQSLLAAGRDISNITRLNNRLNARLSEKAAEVTA